MITYSCIEETKAYHYAWNVVEGKITACEDVFNCCNRFLKDIEKSQNEDLQYYFDLDIMARIENVASCFKFTSGARAGEKIDLAPPQSFILGNIYGWRFKNNKKKRRFRFVFLMISRKNSKSFLIALISLMAMMDEQENETYSFAGKKEQARICFEQAKALIRSNPKVARKFKLNKLEIVLKKNNSKFQPLASEEKTLDGTSPSTAIIDEAYIVPVGVKNSVSSGTGARLSPLIVCITTSYDVPSVGNWAWEDMQYTKKINEGLVDNDRHFGMIYSLDDENEIDKPEMWEKTNPLIPCSPVLMEDLQEAYKRTKLSPAELRNFKIKRMNLILDGIGIDKYLHLPSFRENCIKNIDFNKKYVFYGVDLSITTDLSAVAKCVYDPITDTFEIEVHGFAPKENIHELEVRDGIPYRQYADEGYMTSCKGRIIDQDFIIRALENGDIFFLHQHDNRELPLASVKSNTLELIEDKESNVLKMRAVLSETSFSRDIYELVKSGVLREFSFGFNKPKAKWNVGKDGMKERALVDFDIHEISIVRVGAYNQTQAYARAFEEYEMLYYDKEMMYNRNKLKILEIF